MKINTHMKIKLGLSDWLWLGSLCYLNGEAWYVSQHVVPEHVWLYWVMIGSFDLLNACGLVFTCLYRNLAKQTLHDWAKTTASLESLILAVRQSQTGDTTSESDGDN